MWAPYLDERYREDGRPDLLVGCTAWAKQSREIRVDDTPNHVCRSECRAQFTGVHVPPTRSHHRSTTPAVGRIGAAADSWRREGVRYWPFSAQSR